jgi:hypothetical protein
LSELAKDRGSQRTLHWAWPCLREAGSRRSASFWIDDA